jgi:putative transposase
VTQPARQLSWRIQDGTAFARFLIHDRDTTFPAAFDRVFSSEDVTIIRTPIHTPNANAFAEGWIRSVREECLDQMLILGEYHLQCLLRTYVAYYNHARPHQGLDQRSSAPLDGAARAGPVGRRDLLGGVLHDYYRRAV